MSKNNLPLIKFNPKLPKLSDNEKKVLKLLVEAAELISPLYLEQEEQAKKITKEEIEKAGKSNPAMLSPYTVVERTEGKLAATPYHVKYIDLLQPIADKLNKASVLTNNKQFSNFLQFQARALVKGSYDEAAIASLKLKPYILGFSIGPLNHFDDRLFFAKASYHAWVGVMDVEGTDRLNNYKAVTLSVRRKVLAPRQHIVNLDKVKVRVDDVILFSGLMARTKFVGINLPMDLNIIEKYGSETTLFNQANDLRVQEQILPTFNKIFSKEFKQGFSKEDLRRGYLRTVALHELAHSYLYYKDSAKNLQDLFAGIYEITATVLALRMAGSLLLKDRINNKQLESMIVAFICRSYFLKEEAKINKSMMNYGLGGSIFINFMFESGAIKKYNGLIIPNFTKVFYSLQELSHMLEHLLAQGTKKDVESFIKKY